MSTAGEAGVKMKGSPKSVGSIVWGLLMSAQDFMETQPKFIKIFQSGPKCLTDRSSNAASMAEKITGKNVYYAHN